MKNTRDNIILPKGQNTNPDREFSESVPLVAPSQIEEGKDNQSAERGNAITDQKTANASENAEAQSNKGDQNATDSNSPKIAAAEDSTSTQISMSSPQQ